MICDFSFLTTYNLYDWLLPPSWQLYFYYCAISMICLLTISTIGPFLFWHPVKVLIPLLMRVMNTSWGLYFILSPNETQRRLPALHFLTFQSIALDLTYDQEPMIQSIDGGKLNWTSMSKETFCVSCWLINSSEWTTSTSRLCWFTALILPSTVPSDLPECYAFCLTILCDQCILWDLSDLTSRITCVS
jgi:hypothetical protein